MRNSIFWRIFEENFLAGGVFDASVENFSQKCIQNLLFLIKSCFSQPPFKDYEKVTA
jgi:hypothetical protein